LREAILLDREPCPRTILRVNLKFAQAFVLLLYGWVCWQWTSPEWWGFGIPAILGFAAGAVQFIAAVHLIVAAISRDRKIDQFKRQGGTARADKMPSERDLKNRGMVR